MTELHRQLRRILFHVASATLVWFIVALAIERLIPGFISPFVDIPDFSLVLLVLVILSLAFPPHVHRLGARVAFALCAAIAISLGASFFWSRVNEYGRFGLGEMGVFLLTGAVFLATFLRKPDQLD